MVLGTSLESLGLVSLESIEHGDVGVALNSRLCYVRNIPWADILHAKNQSVFMSRNMASDDCGGYCILFSRGV